ncbi:MAG: flavodoxin family protein [Oscillospiraceae bacterium]
MKIVMLNGQNHKGSTYHIGRMIIDKISGENEVKEFFFPKDLNHFCLGCYKCIEDDTSCPFYEEKKVILDAVKDAELLVITTPTYCMHVSAPLKSLLDMTFDYWMVHKPRKCMFGKRAVVVSTSAGAGTRSAIKDVCDALLYLGVPYVVRYGISVQAMNWQGIAEKKKEKIERDTSRIAKKLDTDKKPTVGLKTRFYFSMMGMMQKNGWGASPSEKEYWKEQGWLDGKKPWDTAD